MNFVKVKSPRTSYCLCDMNHGAGIIFTYTNRSPAKKYYVA